MYVCVYIYWRERGVDRDREKVWINDKANGQM